MMDEKKDKLDKVIKQLFERVKNQGPKGGVCPDEEILAAYYEKKLDKEESERIEEHIAFCSQCAESLFSFAEAKKSYSPDAKAYSTAKMLKRAKSLIEEKEKPLLLNRISSWLTTQRLRPAMVMAAAVLAVVVLGIFRLQAPTPEMPVSAQLKLIARIHPQDVTRGTSQERIEVEVPAGGVLHSGDLVKFRFTPYEDVYAYLLGVDGQGNLNVLFPDEPAGAPAFFKSGEIAEFPKKGNWLELDQNTGKETIFLITSREPIEKIDKKIEKLKSVEIHKINEIFPGSRIQSFRFEHRTKEMR